MTIYFFQADYVTEYLGSSGIDKFDETDFGNDDKAANLAVSDHRPVWALFRIDGMGTLSQPPISSGIGIQEGITSVQEAPGVDEDVQSETVYVTRTGKKYHLGSCSSLRRSKLSISLVEAKQKYSPCSRCNPPR